MFKDAQSRDRAVVPRSTSARADLAVKVTVKSLKIWVALLHEAARLIRVGGQPFRQNAQGIDVLCCNVRIGPNGEMVKVGDQAHEVMRNGRR